MGDTGSLPLGGAFGIIAVLVHQPFVLRHCWRRFCLTGSRFGYPAKKLVPIYPPPQPGTGRRDFP